MQGCRGILEYKVSDDKSGTLFLSKWITKVHSGMDKA